MLHPVLSIIIACFLFIFPCHAQKVLQIEKFGSPKTQKFHIGQELTFRLEGTDYFKSAYIEDIRAQDSLVLLGSSFVNVYDISELRFERTWPVAGGKSLFLFGIGWSGFAFLGGTFDDNPDTNYQWSDAGVTLTAIGLGYLLPRIFRFKHVKIGKRKRLRLLDLRFSKPDWED
jgi:hypothetical protein